MMNLNGIREQFPSLGKTHNGKPLVFFDGPAGTQVPSAVIDGISRYYRSSNANTHGAFVTTRETDELVHKMRTSVAALLGAENGETISIGQNMTSLSFSLARAIGRILRPGDEVVITQLDHEANRGPWLTLRDVGVVVREVKLLPSGVLDYEDMESTINERTRLVCMGMSSNCIGTVNDFDRVRKITHRYNAWLLLDAVHYAPHFTIDVKSIGCDFLLCSAYKFYGPHVGLLYSRPGLLDQIPTDHLRTAGQMAPEVIETGTLNHAAIAGVCAAVEFLGDSAGGGNLRESLVNTYSMIAAHEHQLASRLYGGLQRIDGVGLIGQDFLSVSRAPTVSFTMPCVTPHQVCEALAEENICAWDGHFYAIRAMEVLGLVEGGGVTRLGISLYNTTAEVDFVLHTINRISKKS